MIRLLLASHLAVPWIDCKVLLVALGVEVCISKRKPCLSQVALGMKCPGSSAFVHASAEAAVRCQSRAFTEAANL